MWQCLPVILVSGRPRRRLKASLATDEDLAAKERSPQKSRAANAAQQQCWPSMLEALGFITNTVDRGRKI